MGDWKYSSTIINLGNKCRRVVSFTLRPLYHFEIYTGTHWIGDSVGLIAGLDATEMRETFPLLGIEPRLSNP
jgi:hypothetical protein